MRLIAVLLVAGLAVAQSPRASIAPQGAEALRALTGKRIKGVQVLSVTVCSDVPASISGGMLYQAVARAGIAPISSKLAPAIIERTVDRNWRKIAIELIRSATLIGATLTSSGVITATKTVTNLLIVAHTAGDEVSGILQSRLPDATPLLSNLLASEATISLGAGGCHEALMLAVYSKSTKAQILQL